MNELQIFKNNEFGEIRTVTINNEPWFIGTDIAKALGYSNPWDAIAKHVDLEDKDLAKCEGLGNQKVSIINESGLYSLIMSSKLESAKKFKRWVTSEVLPSIRQNGAYIAGQNELSETELLAKALLASQKIIERREFAIKQLESDVAELQPKALFADAVSTSKSSILVGELAKLICQNGVQIGQNRLFQWLRSNGYLMSNNIPYQRYVEQGLFEIKESTINNPDGSVRVTKTTKVTGKGQIYFVNKFLSKEQQ